ncbi:DUF2142 domain-containing protein [Acidisoma cladoniae]|uniref:DUF2142 domain-containing protein n=1 Tax=Acidisoma cladoniae TaxID=3040935 RepID=UPI00254CC7D3|nr:DUF2142 domain-containing protein [Acidisoma sp. PAMC 29798]
MRIASVAATERAAALAVFILCVVPLVLLCAWRVPIGQAPDEADHVARIASVLDGQIIGHRVSAMNAQSGSQDAGVTVNIGLIYADLVGTGRAAPPPFDTSPAKRQEWARTIPWAPGPIFVSSANTAAYAPLAYGPAAIGMGIAILTGALPHGAIIGARLGNALAFSLLGIAALALARRGRLLLLITLALPMTIWLAGSPSQDGIVIAVAALGAALLTRDGHVAFYLGCAALAVLVLQKPPYLPLAALALLAPGGLSWRRFQDRLPAAIAVAVPGLLWSVAVVKWVAVPLLPSPLYHPGPLWPGNHADLFHSAISAAQGQVLLHHPWRGLLLPPLSLLRQLAGLSDQFIGVLGALTLHLPRPLYGVWWLAILSALGHLAARADQADESGKIDRLLAWAAILCSGELICLTLYLTWTRVGMDVIDGLQGRYFIPLMAMLVLALPHVPVLTRAPRWAWWILPMVALLATDAALPRLIAASYQP